MIQKVTTSFFSFFVELRSNHFLIQQKFPQCHVVTYDLFVVCLGYLLLRFIMCSSIQLFLSAPSLPHRQLWATVKGVTSLT